MADPFVMRYRREIEQARVGSLARTRLSGNEIVPFARSVYGPVAQDQRQRLLDDGLACALPVALDSWGGDPFFVWLDGLRFE